MEGSTEGLRARKKRAARAGIAAAARGLFAERGYDAVTVAEVAIAADVSEKTVFNHFATKEDLVFAGREERLARLVAALEQRPAGVPVLDVFRASTRALLGDPHDDALARIVGGSPALRERVARGWEDEVAAVAAAIGDDLVAAVVARTLVWTQRAILAAALDGQPRGRLRATADRAYDQLATGLGDYGRFTDS